MSRLYAAAASAVIGAGGKVDPATPAGVQPQGLTGFNLTMTEEFGHNPEILTAYAMRFHPGGAVWSTRYPDWLTTGLAQSPYTGNPGIPEQQFYGRDAVTTSAGVLHLTARRLPVANIANPHPGFRYVSGQINSWPGHNQQYGFLEARIRLPGGLCQWPAFWMFPQTYDPAAYHEIDIMECFESGTQITTNNHYGTGGTQIGSTAYGVGTTATWHTYGFEWKADRHRWYVDAVQIREDTGSAHMHPVPMFPILNLATLPRANTLEYPEQMVMDVDYFRFWQAA